jgi:hypothetical protein
MRMAVKSSKFPQEIVTGPATNRWKWGHAKHKKLDWKVLFQSVLTYSRTNPPKRL